MQARVNQKSRYGRISAFSGIEFVKFEWRRVPVQFEEAARTNEYLEIREGKGEKEVVAKQEAAAIKPVMKVRLIESHHEDELRTLGGKSFIKTEWREVPAGFEDSARRHDLLEIWEAGQEEPIHSSGKSKRNRKVKVDDEGEG